MDYYETFKPEAEKVLRPVADDILNLQKQFVNSEKRLIEEKEQGQRLEGRIADLKVLSGDALTRDRNSYEKFKVSLRKLTTELSASREAVTVFENDVLPRKSREISEATNKLRRVFSAFWQGKKSACEKRLTELTDIIIAEYDDFQSSVVASAEDFGIPVEQLHVEPAIRHQRLFVPGNECVIAYKKPVAKQVQAQDELKPAPEKAAEPATEQTPPDPVQQPPQAVSEVVEAKAGRFEPFETTPETPSTTLLTGQCIRLKHY